MPSEDAAHDIFVDLDAKRVSTLLGNSRTPESRIAALHFEDRRDEFLRGPFGPWSLTGSGKHIATLPCGPGHWNSPIVLQGEIILPEGSANNHATSGVLDIWSLPS
jgi:hypothetical protein